MNTKRTRAVDRYIDLKTNGRLFPTWIMANFRKFKLPEAIKNANDDPCIRKQTKLQLHKYQFEIMQGKATSQVLATLWSSKQSLYKAALNRLSYKKLHSILRSTLNLDKCTKGLTLNDFWPLFESICIAICSGNVKLLEACHD